MMAVVSTRIRFGWMFICCSIIAISMSAGYFVLFPISSHSQCPSLKAYGITMFITYGWNTMLWVYGSCVSVCKKHVGTSSHIFANMILLMFLGLSCLSIYIAAKCDSNDINYWNHYIENTSSYVTITLFMNCIITGLYVITIIILAWYYGCDKLHKGVKTCNDECQTCFDKCKQSEEAEYQTIA